MITSVEKLPLNSPAEFNLDQNYPNPFNPSTTISYSLPIDGKVTIKIFDIMGREVESLADGIQTSGVHSVIWKGTNMIGNESASGIYFYNIRYNGKSITKKLVLLR